MTQNEFERFQEETFDSYVKRLIRNEAIDAKRELATRAKREVALTDLSRTDIGRLSYEDSYDPTIAYLHVQGVDIPISDRSIGRALLFLPPKWREVLILYYYFEKSDAQIAKQFKMSTATIYYRRGAALLRLKRELEAMGYER